MNKFIILVKILMCFVKIHIIKLISKGGINAYWKQLLALDFCINISDGMLDLGKAIMSRSNFNLIVKSGKCSIGDYCFFNHNCSITCLNEVVVGNKCTFGNNVVIVDHDHNRDGSGFALGSVIIEDGTWVGANAVILRNTHIGKSCIIAAGSVVKGRVPDNTIYVQKRITEIKDK